MISGEKILEYIISAKDLTKQAINSAKSRLKSFADSVKSKSEKIGKNLMNIYAGFKMVAGAVKIVAHAFSVVIQKAFDFETVTTQFEVLLHSVDRAKERIQDLSVMAAHTPFTLNDLTTASRQLHVFTNGSLGGVGSLEMIGDASAATGANIQELSFWIGRLYSMIAGGKPFGEAAMRLQELGIMTPEVRMKMEDLQASGANMADVWKVLTNRLSEFKGGMNKLSTTGNGLISTLQDNWSASLRKFGNAFSNVAKTGIEKLSDSLVKLSEDGTIERWATRTYNALSKVYHVCKDLKDGFMAIWNSAGKVDQAIGDFLERIPGMGEIPYSGRAVNKRRGDEGYRARMIRYAQEKKERDTKARKEKEQEDAEKALQKANDLIKEKEQAKAEQKIAEEKAKRKAKVEQDLAEANADMWLKIIDEDVENWNQADLKKEKEKKDSLKKQAKEEKEAKEIEFRKAEERERQLQGKLNKLRAGVLTPDQMGINAKDFVENELAKEDPKKVTARNNRDREKALRRMAYLEREKQKFANGGKMSRKREREFEALKDFFGLGKKQKHEKTVISLLNKQVIEARDFRRKLEKAMTMK